MTIHTIAKKIATKLTIKEWLCVTAFLYLISSVWFLIVILFDNLAIFLLSAVISILLAAFCGLMAYSRTIKNIPGTEIPSPFYCDEKKEIPEVVIELQPEISDEEEIL